MSFTHLPITLPTLEQRTLETGRIYVVADGPHAGNTYPSITRVLGSRPKPHLDAWRKREGAEKADKITRQASTRGHTIHNLAELYINNQTQQVDQIETILSYGTKDMWLQLKAWITAHISRVRAQEVDLYSHHLKVAGRTDLLADYDDVYSVIDFKNSTKLKDEKYIEDYKLQGTFYAVASYELTQTPIKQIVIPVVSPDGLQVFITRPGKHFSTLRHRIDDYYEKYHVPTEAVV